MSKAKKDDLMYCPDCGAYIKKGFMTCANCGSKLELTKEMEKEEEEKSSKEKENNFKKNKSFQKEKTIYIGSDHAGFKLKTYLKKYLLKIGYKPVDMGNEKYEPGDDYPDYAHEVAKKVSETNGRGIILCDSGVGVCIAANKVKGIRAVNAVSPIIAQMSRKHNNTNILCMGQNYIKPNLAKKILKVWLETEFTQEERHHRRVDKINRI